ncbi:MAG: hypothetical protein M1825_004150 [Sarcosagium campestre]|nr:MAG: hypothetical protein M1825_004150 [Sarcosagium campestre]
MLPDKSISWRHYFKSTFVKRQKETHTIKRSAQTPRPTHFTFKQIRPDGRYQPTLLKPDSIGTAATDERPAGTPQSRDSDTFFFGSSRPTTPSRLSALFTPPQDEPSQPLKSAGPERQPRRSFSIADMFGSSPTSWVSRSHPSQSASTSRDKATQGRRNSSAPLTSVPSRLIMSAHGSRAGRRNITDPAFFQTDDPPPIPSSPRIQLAPRNAGTNVWDASVSHAQPIQKSHAYRTTLHNDARPQSRSPHLSGTPQPRLRLSLAASTLVGSDVEQRSSSVGDEGDFDFQSDTVFDSLRTGTTNYSTHGKGTNLESIFDETRQFRVSGQDSALPSSGQSSSGPDLSIPTMSDKDNVSLTTGREGELAVEPVFGTLATVRGNAAYDGNPPSSPPEINSARHTSPRNLTIPDREREYTRLSFDDDDDDDDQDWGRNDEDIEITSHLSSPQSVRRPPWTSPLIGPEETEGQRTGRLGSRSFATKDALTSLFGYSEQPPHDKSGGDASNERPKTVSGKNVSEGRGGRSHGRRGPSAMHVRSQSVPVLPDPHTTHENGVSGHPRYGTWGLGSKAINEDWNEDFDFGFPGGERAESSTEDCARAEIGSATMIVPRAIQERQESVIGHLSHVKEFALLVEDLKRLRTLAISKDIINGPTADMWKEAEGIIDLATLDEENQEAVPPQSPAFTNPGSDPFDEDSSPSLTYGRGRRKSVLSIEDDIFGGAVISPDSSADPTSKMSTPSSVRISGRPDRQDTSAIARSVIESIHQRRTTSDPALNPIDPNPQSKMPFDTTTLRDLVAHVSGLSRKLGDVVRRAESRSSSQAQSPAFSAPSVSQVLAESVSGSPSVSKTRLPRSQSSNGVIPGPIGSTDNDMGGHYSLMTVI